MPDNASGAKKAKVDLRSRVLSQVEPANVLDLFCGHGEMWHSVWRCAASYAGCDERPIETGDPPRFWCDNKVLLRSLDLQRYNIFDLDAYGSPWAQMVILAARRTWESGERGAVVLTDGGNMKSRYGGRCVGLQDLLGERGAGERTGVSTALMASRRALNAWVNRAAVRVTKRWQAQGNGSGRGGQIMVYTAIVFEGLS